jgi:hypothetical protein
MLGLIVGVLIGFAPVGHGMHFNPDADLSVVNVVVPHQCSTDCGGDD